MDLDKLFDTLLPKIEEMSEVSDTGWSHDRSLAMQELDSCAVILWGTVFDFCLCAYHTCGGLDLDKNGFQECRDIYFDERTQPLTRHILKQTLKGRVVALGELAEHRYRRNSQNFGKLTRKLRDDVLWRMRDIQVWSVDVVNGTDRNGKKRVLCYKISAGPFLLSYHERVFVPLRRKQIIAVGVHLQEEESS